MIEELELKTELTEICFVIVLRQLKDIEMPLRESNYSTLISSRKANPSLIMLIVLSGHV